MKIQEFQNFLTSDKIYTPTEMLNALKSSEFLPVSTKTKHKYLNVACAFDIETSSFYVENEKTACMYIWTFGINGAVCVGRTWAEFIQLLYEISHVLHLNDENRLIVYVHNLSYEFQFIRKWLKWKKVFAIDKRKPIYAISDINIEFRCSYLLSGYSLEKLGDQLQKYNVKKLVGSLDYEKIRHNQTPLTPDELAYCVNDVKVVLAYIMEKIEMNCDISRLPLTKTGYVRNYCRNMCFFVNGVPCKHSYKRVNYTDMIKGMTVSIEEYKQLKRAFQGGFTHANPFHVGKVVKDVTSYDFTSSYPTVLVAERFPISSSEKIQITSAEQFYRNLKLYCCIFDVHITGLESIIFFENYLSVSRCGNVIKPIINNGRLVAADELYTTLIEQDFMIMKKFYRWKKFEVANFRRYKKGYLPTDFVKSILKLYADKTTLKGVEGKEAEYLNSKEMLNACFGMCVTDIVRDEICYDYEVNEWDENDELTKDEKIGQAIKQIKKYNTNINRFLFYPWGVWCTAYARRNLFTGILEFKGDYVYSDTDSIKVINSDQHMNYIDRYNDVIRQQLYRAADFHGIPRDAVEPLTIKGVKKCLGLWDFDGHYAKFKTLGAKRYMVQYSDDERNGPDKGKINITVAGLNKKTCVPYLLKKYGEKGIFDAFNDEMYIPADYTGKNTHTYIDERCSGVVVDYLGVPGQYDEVSYIHLEKADYSLSMSSAFINYILSIEDE